LELINIHLVLVWTGECRDDAVKRRAAHFESFQAAAELGEEGPGGDRPGVVEITTAEERGRGGRRGTWAVRVGVGDGEIDEERVGASCEKRDDRFFDGLPKRIEVEIERTEGRQNERLDEGREEVVPADAELF